MRVPKCSLNINGRRSSLLKKNFNKTYLFFIYSDFDNRGNNNDKKNLYIK